MLFNGKEYEYAQPQADSTHLGDYLQRAQDRAVAGASAAHKQLQAAKAAQAKKLRDEERAQAQLLKGRVRPEQLFKLNSLPERG
jgi:hypothetical protein